MSVRLHADKRLRRIIPSSNVLSLSLSYALLSPFSQRPRVKRIRRNYYAKGVQLFQYFYDVKHTKKKKKMTIFTTDNCRRERRGVSLLSFLIIAIALSVYNNVPRDLPAIEYRNNVVDTTINYVLMTIVQGIPSESSVQAKLTMRAVTMCEL